MSIHSDHHFSVKAIVIKGDKETREAVHRLQGVCAFRTEEEALEAATQLKMLIKRFIFTEGDKQPHSDHHNGFILVVDQRDGTPQTLCF